MMRSILLPTDLSAASLKGFNWVTELAAWRDAALHVLHVVPTTPLYEPVDLGIHDLESPGEDAFFEELEKRLPERLKMTGSYRHAVRIGYSVTDEIVRYASEHDIDLIAMGTRGHRSWLHPSLGGTTGGVLRQASCLVLTWHVNGRSPGEHLGPPRHILAPVDFSAHSEDMLKTARTWAEHYGAKLSVLFVAEQRIVPIFNDTLIPSVHVMHMDEEQVVRAGQALAMLVNTSPAPAHEMETFVRTGHPASEILAFVEREHVDLVMMSSHGLRSAPLFSLGGTSEQVIRKATCAVLTLKVNVNTK